MIKNEELTIYQIIDCLVTQYNYQIIGFPGQKHDVWLSSRNNVQYPMIRISAAISSSAVFEGEYMHKVVGMFRSVNHFEAPLLIINTNIESASYQEDEFIQVLANNDTIAQPLLEEFPLLQDAIHPVTNNDLALNAIRAKLKALQLKSQQEARRRATMPKATLWIMGIVAVCYLFQISIRSSVGSDTVDWLIISGGLYKTFMQAANEWWRLLSAGFMHAGVFHLMMNLMALYSLGAVCEQLYSRRNYLIILFTSIIFGNILCYVAGPNVVSVGISGGLYGLMCAAIVGIIENGTIRIPSVRNSVLQMVLINIIISLMPNISMYAHLGGAVVGGFMGFLLIKSPKWKTFKIHALISFIILLAGVGYLWVKMPSVQPTYPGTDYQIVDELKNKLHVDFYADYLKTNLDNFYGK